MKVIGSIFLLVMLLTACTTKNIEDNKNQNSPYMNLSTDTPSEEQDMIDEEVQTTNPKLPFQGFTQRWNALSEQQLSDLHIRGLEKVDSGTSSYYRAELTSLNEIRIFASEGHVEQIELISEAKTKEEVLKMLSAWTQIINILHPDIEFIDADSFFHEIGVGPDGDLSHLKETSLPYNQLYFKINRTEKGYYFSASYQDKT